MLEAAKTKNQRDSNWISMGPLLFGNEVGDVLGKPLLSFLPIVKVQSQAENTRTFFSFYMNSKTLSNETKLSSLGPISWELNAFLS